LFHKETESQRGDVIISSNILSLISAAGQAPRTILDLSESEGRGRKECPKPGRGKEALLAVWGKNTYLTFVLLFTISRASSVFSHIRTSLPLCQQYEGQFHMARNAYFKLYSLQSNFMTVQQSNPDYPQQFYLIWEERYPEQ
jgi:hypothetical protein